MDVSSSPVERDSDIQDVRSPSKKGNMEVDDNILNPSEHPRASKESDPFVDDLTESARQIKDLSENSPAKKRVLEDVPEKVPGQETSSQCFESSSKKQELHSQRESEEHHFYRLFQNVLDVIAKQENLSDENIRNALPANKKAIKRKLSDEEIGEAVSTVKTSFCYDLGNRFSLVDLTSSANICGYLFRYTTLHAGLVRFRCLQAIQNCSILEHTLRKTELRVVTLGGGPGNGVIGFLSAFHAASPNAAKLCHLKVSVLDKVDAWKDCVDLVNNLIQKDNYDYGSVSKMCKQTKVDITFHTIVLPCKKDCKKDNSCYSCCSLKKADIVLVSRLITILDWPEKSEIMQYVHKLIQNTSLVLFIDAPFYEDMLKYLEILYRSEEDKYKLCKTNERFNRSECESSKAGITVLRKIIG